MDDGHKFILVLLLVVGAAAAAYWFYGRPAPEPAPVPAESAAPEPASATEAPGPQEPRYPLPADESPETPKLEELPDLDDSDGYFRMDVADLFGETMAGQLVRDALIERLVATIDNLPRQRVAERVRPVAMPDTPFSVADSAEGERLVLAEENFRRYDAQVEAFASADTDRIVELYTRYYPLFQKAYTGLGYPDGYFNDRLVEVIDHLLETPDVEAPIELERPHVLYRYADPELEALSGGQKLMIRIGPEHRARVMRKLRELRARLVEVG